ncbi:Aldehyde/histidinol dehydrogenase [Lipomyces japonicus]|uniref:Aldehyde/histidinol dehydrogenase n=1 Tax=Lipomyces japonicus TaxID=56871 RepID=UPI0034CD8CF6
MTIDSIIDDTVSLLNRGVQQSDSSNLPLWLVLLTATIPTVGAILLIAWLSKLVIKESLPNIKYQFPPEAETGWDFNSVVPPNDAPKIPSLFSETNPESIYSYCPTTGAYLGRFNASTRIDIDLAVQNASKAQRSWKNTTFEKRKRVLRTLLKYFKEHQDEVVRVACRDSGKTMVDAALGEVMVTLEKLSWTIKHGENALKMSKRPGPANLLIRYKSAEVVYEPLGVVLAIISWNYPLHNLLNPVISSIFTGNSIVIKCSESVIWSSTHFAKLVRTVIASCGHDPDIVQLVCPLPQDADYLTSHPRIAQATFIGSKPVAHRVLYAAATSLTPVTVELGGKDAAIILDEYQSSWNNCEALASVLLRGSFQSAGQNCIGIERIIAEPKAYEALTNLLSRRVPQIKVGSQLDENEENIDVGAMINDSRFAALEELIEDAVKNGARLVHGGKQYKHPKYPLGSYFSPTLLVDVKPSMKIAQCELFAPVIVLMRAESVADAIRIANEPKFGLGGSVFGKRGSDATEKVVREMRTGNIAVNDFATFYVCQLPFGGVFNSGYGKFGGEEGLRALCLAKSVCRDKYPFISTSIPSVVDYPLANVKKGWQFVRSLNAASYADGTWEFISNLLNMGKSSL